MPKLTKEQLSKSGIISIVNSIATEREIKAACSDAKTWNTAAIYVNGSYIATAKKELEHTSVALCSTIDFPFGGASIEAKCAEISTAIALGADEVAAVLQIGRIKMGHFDYVDREIEEMLKAAGDIPLTIMMECSYLDDEEKVAICEIVKKHGIAYLQSNTEFGQGGATISDVSLIRQCVGAKVGVVAAGGIRSAQDVAAMLEAGANRVSTPYFLHVVKELES